jgi:hypothetical protein
MHKGRYGKVFPHPVNDSRKAGSGVPEPILDGLKTPRVPVSDMQKLASKQQLDLAEVKAMIDMATISFSKSNDPHFNKSKFLKAVKTVAPKTGKNGSYYLIEDQDSNQFRLYVNAEPSAITHRGLVREKMVHMELDGNAMRLFPVSFAQG